MSKKKQRLNPDAAVIYARYSSHAQKDASIEQQVEECTKYAEENNLKIVEIYSDRAVTGRTDCRPNFQRMMKDAEKRKFANVIAWKSNRIGRDMLQSMINEAKLDGLGIRVLYTEENFDDTAAGRFALRSMMNVNQFYSENMAEDIKRGLYDNAVNCKITNGQLPFGYKKGDDGRYALDEPKDAIVREIFSRVACGDPYVDIAADLNRRGIKTSRGSVWNRSSFHSITSNERYTGVYIYGDIRIDGGVPQIIDRDLFLRVQEVLKTKKNPIGRHHTNGDYLLTGKLYCGHCKSPMFGVSGTGRSGQLHHYYICRKKKVEKDCNKKTMRRDTIELAVATKIRETILSDDVVGWMADGVIDFQKKYKEDSGVKILHEQLSETKKAIKNLLTAIEQGIITETTKDRLVELEGEQSRISMKLSMENASILEVTREDVISALELYRDGCIADKKYQKMLFSQFLKAVYVYDDDDNTCKIVFSYSGKNNSIEFSLNPDDIDNLESLSSVRSSSPLVHQNFKAPHKYWVYAVLFLFIPEKFPNFI